MLHALDSIEISGNRNTLGNATIRVIFDPGQGFFNIFLSSQRISNTGDWIIGHFRQLYFSFFIYTTVDGWTSNNILFFRNVIYWALRIHEFRRKERNRKMRVNWINSIPRIGYRRENVDWLRKVEEGKCQPEPEVVRERHLALRVKSAVELQVYGIPRSTWLTHCMLLTFLPPLGHPPSDGLIIPHHTNISMQPHSFTSD